MKTDRSAFTCRWPLDRQADERLQSLSSRAKRLMVPDPRGRYRRALVPSEMVPNLQFSAKKGILGTKTKFFPQDRCELHHVGLDQSYAAPMKHTDLHMGKELPMKGWGKNREKV